MWNEHKRLQYEYFALEWKLGKTFGILHKQRRSYTFPISPCSVSFFYASLLPWSRIVALLALTSLRLAWKQKHMREYEKIVVRIRQHYLQMINIMFLQTYPFFLLAQAKPCQSTSSRCTQLHRFLVMEKWCERDQIQNQISFGVNWWLCAAWSQSILIMQCIVVLPVAPCIANHDDPNSRPASSRSSGWDETVKVNEDKSRREVVACVCIRACLYTLHLCLYLCEKK